MKKIVCTCFVLIFSQLYAIPGCESIAMYHFSNNANDETTNHINGTIHNVLLTTDRKNCANSAYSFNGYNSYIDLGNNPLLKRYATDFTISAWVCLKSYSSEYASPIVSNRDQNNIGSSLSIGGRLWHGGRVCFTIQGGANTSTAASNTVLELNKWYFVAATYSYSGGNVNETKIYVNGVLETTSYLKNIIQPYTTSTYIGFEPSPLVSVHYHLHGKIDEVNISNCTLSDKQILNCYEYTPAESPPIELFK
ncbi:LamG domain-containing protein [Cytophaga aurantiaca]|uniref:LamG domain-containing protein n=1 Tax=Cytophaga aurantiaca TaxID=29530 RepID=UPI00038133B9|nr:LamG domain-containing protein [Cytophaga aurantiaca]